MTIHSSCTTCRSNLLLCSISFASFESCNSCACSGLFHSELGFISLSSIVEYGITIGSDFVFIVTVYVGLQLDLKLWISFVVFWYLLRLEVSFTRFLFS